MLPKFNENLAGLPLMGKVRRLCRFYYSFFSDSVKVFCKTYEKQIRFVGNYGLNAIFLGIAAYLLFSLWIPQSILRFLGSIVFFWCFLPYMEEYYMWFREKWREDLGKR